MPPSAERLRPRRDLSVPERDRPCFKGFGGAVKEKPLRNVRRDLKRLAELAVRTTCRDSKEFKTKETSQDECKSKETGPDECKSKEPTLKECLGPDKTSFNERSLSTLFRNCKAKPNEVNDIKHIFNFGKRATLRQRCRPGCFPKTPQGLPIIRDNASPGVARALDWTLNDNTPSDNHTVCNDKTPQVAPSPPGARPIPSNFPPWIGRNHIPRDNRSSGVAEALKWLPEHLPPNVPAPTPGVFAPPMQVGALPRMEVPPPSAHLPAGGCDASARRLHAGDNVHLGQPPPAFCHNSKPPHALYCDCEAKHGLIGPRERNILLDYMKSYCNCDIGRQQSPTPSTHCHDDIIPTQYSYENDGHAESATCCHCGRNVPKPKMEENAAYCTRAPCPYCLGAPNGCSYCCQATRAPSVDNTTQANPSSVGRNPNSCPTYTGAETTSEPCVDSTTQANPSPVGRNPNSCPICGTGTEITRPTELRLQLNLPLDLLSMQLQRQIPGGVWNAQIDGSPTQNSIPLTLRLLPPIESSPVYCAQ